MGSNITTKRIMNIIAVKPTKKKGFLFKFVIGCRIYQFGKQEATIDTGRATA